MTDYDEEQPASQRWRPPTSRSPWSSPGYGQPYPGEAPHADPSATAPTAPTSPTADGPGFAYPYTPPAYPGAAPYRGSSSSPAPGRDGADAAPGQTNPGGWPGAAGWQGDTRGWTVPDGGGWPVGGSGSGGWQPTDGSGGWQPTDGSGGWQPTVGGGGWQGGWAPPPQPPGYGGWGSPQHPGWGPPVLTPPKRNNPMAVVGVAILIAAIIGLAIGSQLVRPRTTTSNLPSFFPSQPSSSSPAAAGGLPSAQMSAVAANVGPSVVDIDTKLGYQEAAAAGTGMILTSNGEVVTNNHVIAGATTVVATVVGGKTYSAKVLGTDPTDDIALIQLIGASGLKPIRTGDPTKLTPGQPIVAVGNAGGVGGTPTVVTGSVLALDQSVSASDTDGGNPEQLSGMIEINAPLQPGDSGGPLLTAAGLVVGMDTAASSSNRFDSQASVGFAIPITRAISIAQQIAAGHGSSTVLLGLPGFLGVSVSAETGGESGAEIVQVLPGGPADKAGLAVGDLITAVNGQNVSSPNALTTLLQQRHSGDRVTITWTDPSGNDHTASTVLIVGPAA